jgi:predicted ABC-type ATPase
LTALLEAIKEVRSAQTKRQQPLAIVLAGHNGSGKSTMWLKLLANELQMPLINADRMMLSILPERDANGALVEWARTLRDNDQNWMAVAQQGVQAFVAHAMNAKVPFAMETVFSHWKVLPDSTVESKIDLIRDLQKAKYFVLLIFVGLGTVELSIGRVATRVAENGHSVPEDRLLQRFPRTQKAIAEALRVADATLLADNSRTEAEAFTVCRAQIGTREVFDLRAEPAPVPSVISRWLNIVSPRA